MFFLHSGASIADFTFTHSESPLSFKLSLCELSFCLGYYPQRISGFLRHEVLTQSIQAEVSAGL